MKEGITLFPEKLLLLRKEAQETQRQLAKFLGITQSAINKWESDKNQPDIQFLNMIADHYNVSVDYLTGRTQIRQGNIPEKLRHPVGVTA
jgi:transcriptional regulator with XRE-family HTH domain